MEMDMDMDTTDAFVVMGGTSEPNLLSKLSARLAEAGASGDEPMIERRRESTKELSNSLSEVIRKLHCEADFGEPHRGVGSINLERDKIAFNDYKPIQRIPLSDRAERILTINNELAKNIIGIQFQYRIVIYELERKKTSADEFFTLKKIQKVSTSDSAFQVESGGMVLAFSMNPTSDISSPVEKRLSYCFSFVEHPTIYLINQSTKGNFNTSVSSNDPGVFQLKGHARDVTYVAFDAKQGELLASLSDDCTCVIWNTVTKEVHHRFALQSFGVACLWHTTDPHKLLIVEQEGKIRMVNTMKQCVVFTLNTHVQPIYSADWSIKNSLIVGVGTYKAAYVFDISKLNSQAGRKIDTHSGATNYFKFSTTDTQMCASATCYLRGEIKVFQNPYSNFVWSQKRECQGISWLFAEPFLLAISGQDLLIYESSRF